MFPRKTLDMIVLSILNETSEGLTGYSIVKEIKNEFGDERAPSPGTIYPRLNKLKFKGDIIEKGNLFFISPKGIRKLTRGIPDIIDFVPKLFKTILNPIAELKKSALITYKEWLETELEKVKLSLERLEKKSVKIEIMDDYED